MEQNQERFQYPKNLKPYIVVGLGFLVVVVSAYQLVTAAPGSIVDANRGSKEVASGTEEETDSREEFIENLDSDSDGLTDVEEEQVYQTDPALPDTDGDGFTDGVEIQNNYDPRVNQDDIAGLDPDASEDDYLNYNRFMATTPDDLSKFDPASYLSEDDIAKLQNGETPEDIDEIATLALANAAIQEDQILPDVSDSEIIISEAQGKDAVQQYIFAVGQIFFTNAPFVGQSAAIEYAKAALTGDEDKIRKLMALSAVGVRDLKAVPVPKEMVSIHKRAIGILETFIQSSNTLLKDEDVAPKDGLEAINHIRVITRGVEDLMSEIFTITKRYGINFSF